MCVCVRESKGDVYVVRVSVCVCASKSESERDERNEIRKWRRVEKFFELPQKRISDILAALFDIENFFLNNSI